MLNFTIGPVMSGKEVLEIGSHQVPYFRTPEFSELMMENERLMKRFAKAEEAARTVFITGSGTASMEATVMNLLTSQDKAIVVNGGSFGERFVELCQLHGIPFTEIKLAPGEPLTAEHLAKCDGQGHTALLINVHETSTGVYYDMRLVSEFVRRNALLLIVDAISSFLADPFDMQSLGADVMIAGSQKALACPPGISAIVLSPKAIAKIHETPVKCMYLDLKNALSNGERGQTPFTPAVGILLQIHQRLLQIEANGGAEAEIRRTQSLADDFRQKATGLLPLRIFSPSLSNALTPFEPLRTSAYDIFTTLKDRYGIWICPNGGELRDKVFRVGHIGALTPKDNDTLIEAMTDMNKKGLMG